jgi:saccharopine dehydrogenase-like NADP-dependent oxidoreductase
VSFFGTFFFSSLLFLALGHVFNLSLSLSFLNSLSTLARAEANIAELKHASAVQFDIEADGADEQLDQLTQQVDLVVSLLPYVFHVQAAKVAIRHKKNFCTTSYVSDAMQELDAEIKAAGIISLNECGVDPGLDHMSAQKVIDEVHAKGGQVREFYSVTGGLPSPAANTNPYGYKLSWSPRGVLLASRNNAVLLRDNEIVNVPGKELFAADNCLHAEFGDEIGELEWYYNRDSVKYRDIYNIPEVRTLIRGTYRFPGWCALMHKISNFGFTSMDEVDIVGHTYEQLTRSVLNIDAAAQNTRDAVAEKLGLASDDAVIDKLVWIGLLDADRKVPDGTNTVLDALCVLFQEKLVYTDGEQDMIVMRHRFEIEHKNGDRQTRTSTMINVGQQPDGFSSMSRTVSLPVAAAVKLILDGTIKLTGVQRPVIPDIYEPVLKEMASLGIKFVEETHPRLFWIRSEDKPGEERVALTPKNASRLLQAGNCVYVERSPHRCFDDEEYEQVGCKLVPQGSWKTDAPYSAIIFGLKELPESDEPLKHRHISFFHVFKQQAGWKQFLARCRAGGGHFWDLEFLKNANGRRVAAMGRPAGIMGMALSLITWAAQETKQEVQKPLVSWKTLDALCADVKASIDQACAVSGRDYPKAIVLGALGRVGDGAVWLAEQVGVATTKWDLAETKNGGPFPQLLEHEVLVNCIYLTPETPCFISNEELDAATDRKLTVFSDVSCDYPSPYNPFPFYSEGTTVFDPVLRVRDGVKPLDVIAIDHLPCLIPSYSSDCYSDDLIDTIVAPNYYTDAVWTGALDLFHEKMAEAEQ